jgi:spore coat polysaccharide biosynthesis protein SpsF (cytidylyltransferase family)
LKVVAILQQRMGSKRLPGKALLPLAGKSMTENIIERVKRAKRLDAVVLAVPPQDENAFTAMPCRVHAPLVDENDLVGRYLITAERCHADIVVRVPCDNPCIQPEYIDEVIGTYLTCDVTFSSNTTAKVNGKWVDGVGAEVFSTSRLKILDYETRNRECYRDASYREHPHKYFNYILPKADLRLDVNTQADFDLIKDIYDHFGHNRFHVSEALAYLESVKV